MDKVRVLVANRPRLMREAVRTALSRHADMEVVGEIEDEFEILSAIERTQACTVTQVRKNDAPLCCFRTGGPTEFLQKESIG